MASRQAALTAKLPASSANAPAVPTPAAMTPPSAGPSRLYVTVRLVDMSALPCTSSSAGSSSGTTAVDAGKNSASAAPNTTAMTTSCQSWSNPAAVRAAMSATATPRVASDTIIATRLDMRSTMTPPAMSSSTVGMSRAASTIESANGRASSCSVSSASATVKTPSPIIETLRPDQSSAKSR